MGWMKQLSNVYDFNDSQIGVFEEKRNQRITLLPVSHVMQSAQIEVLLSLDGQFKSAKVINKENARTIIPATTSSANRANSSAPHYIHDKLEYVAGDYVKYGGPEKRKDHYKHYMEQMRGWAQYKNAPKKIELIYSYLSTGKLLEDLINAQIMFTDSNNKIIDKWTSKDEKPPIYNEVSNGALSALVRFDIFHEDPNENVVWEDTHLFKSFISYLESVQDQDLGHCYVTGEKAILTTQHGSRVRNAGDMAKLISANDHSGYTYRGRFSKPTDAVEISYEVSQKAHHALRWLIQRQGTYVDSRYFLSYGIEEKEVPQPFDSSLDIVGVFFNQASNLLSKETPNTDEITAKEINKAIEGLKHDLEINDLKNIVIIALDAATRGRLAIVYYQKLNIELYFEAIEHWHNSCYWLQTYKDPQSNKIKTYVGSPSTYRIAEAVYGNKADSRVKKEIYTRLLPCIVEKKAIPKDIVLTIFNRVKNPFSFTNSRESWNTTINIACALINKLHEGEGYGMALQNENHSRDYLFGRLLGVAEVMERGILKERGENRATNATRYFNAMTQHPSRTWMVIRKQLTPYFERSGHSTGYYAMLLQQIEDKLTTEQMTNEPLKPVFLLGYSSQVQSLYTKKEEQ